MLQNTLHLMAHTMNVHTVCGGAHIVRGLFALCACTARTVHTVHALGTHTHTESMRTRCMTLQGHYSLMAKTHDS